jgi:mono/diheme cytochrome c family protein
MTGRLTMAGVAVLLAVAPPAARADSPEASAAGVTLRSVSAEWPDSDRPFPDRPGADLAAANCSGCHSPAMVLMQPNLPPAVWQAEVEKMRAAYKAPVEPRDVPAIVAYLTAIKGTR